MIASLSRAALCLMLLALPALAQDDPEPAPDDSLMVDPALSDDPTAVAPAEPSAAEREAAVAVARGPATERGRAPCCAAWKCDGSDPGRPAVGRAGGSFVGNEVRLALDLMLDRLAEPSSDAFAELRGGQAANAPSFPVG
ncbi:DUF2155 domain-containing protein [Paracoccus mutanolyticus]|uniref:DUF2155 domain-containing protein n=1 Tax=Paracoccus mutanolyticus TaxID=1499308 RepID=A0ABN5MD47_9RHOB|nr:DUF2155 domain-containing protein [Paracoccus mutanolyticus]AWX94205.1 DUF2155 domain-containing protein [Paracoccus mutanolyticus]